MAGKPITNLADLTPKRTGPRPVPVPSEAETATTAPEPAEAAPARRRQPSRAKTVMIAGHFEADVSFALHELLGKLTRQRGKRMTMQQAIAESLTLFFEKHGATPPDGLTQGDR
jgi:Antitoxin-like ribbon-helix-helix